ncbi:MAG: hypothetical protein KA408_02950 [Flavobacteriales bacterium]|nr:hypothetical protein [Flavobacteriales bacterium]
MKKLISWIGCMFKGWTNGERAFAVCLVFAIVVLGLCPFTCYEGQQVIQPDHKTDPNDAANYYNEIGLSYAKRDLYAQWVMALGTLALLGVTLYFNRKAFTHAVVSSNKAIYETKRSVDAYIDNERGIMACTRSELVPFMGMHPLYTYINIGKSAVIIESWAQQPQFVESQDDAFEPVFSDTRMASILITPGGRFSNGDNPNLIMPRSEMRENFPWNDLHRVPHNGERSIIMHYQMIYYCPAFDTRRISRYTVFHRNGQMVGVPIGPGTLTFDRPVKSD